VNVQPEDAKGNATYACVVENRVMRGIQRGEYNKISPHGGSVTCGFLVACSSLYAVHMND